MYVNFLEDSVSTVRSWNSNRNEAVECFPRSQRGSRARAGLGHGWVLCPLVLGLHQLLSDVVIKPHDQDHLMEEQVYFV